jgi:hypothetical protein
MILAAIDEGVFGQMHKAVCFKALQDGNSLSRKRVSDKIAPAICQMESPSAASQGWAAAEFQIGLITAIHRAIPRPKMM